MSVSRLSRSVLAGALAFGLSAPSMAQTAPLGPAATAPGTTQPSPAQVALAADLIVKSGAVRSFESLLPNIVEQIRTTFTRQRPELSKDIEASLNALVPELQQQRDAILQVAARIYASRLSEQELRDANAFFGSPSGQKYVTQQTVIFDQLFNEMQSWMERTSDSTVARLREEMKKRGHDL